VTSGSMFHRVAVVTNTIPPYRTAVFSRLTGRREIALRLFLSLGPEACDPVAKEALPITYTRGLNLKWRTSHARVGTTQTEILNLPLALPVHLLRFRPTLVISGEFGPRSLVAMSVARMVGAPLVLWTEEIEETAAEISSTQRLLRRWLLPRAQGFLAWGDPAVNHLRSIGIDDTRIYPCAQAVDNGSWERMAAAVDRDAQRSRLGLQNRVFLAVGRLIERKGFAQMLEAWARMPEHLRRRNTLVIVGDGPEEDRLRGIALRIAGADIRLVGRCEGRDLAAWFAVADVFVFPSLVDVWGLVVNEAMACGLPVLASRHAGASQQLVRGTGAGELIDPTDIGGFASVLARWCQEHRLPSRDLPREVVSKVSFDVTERSLVRLLAGTSP
jgi:glycosyltransferase involved in cell wall biosynthesis